jgi:phosphate transport system protein
VKDKLKHSAMTLSGGQQQRLCIARTIAVEPDLISWTSRARPSTTLHAPDRGADLGAQAGLHDHHRDPQHAAGRAGFRHHRVHDDGRRPLGFVVEQGPTLEIFTNPKHQLTEDYVSGRFGDPETIPVTDDERPFAPHDRRDRAPSGDELEGNEARRPVVIPPSHGIGRATTARSPRSRTTSPYGLDGRGPDPGRDRGPRRHDADAALQVIIDDAQINELQRKATAMIAATIATQNPVARDLRYLLTLDHVSYELERMGDHAGSVAKQARKLAPHAPLKDYVHLPLLGERVANLVHGIVRALVEVDDVGAREVAKLDDEVDELYHRIFDEVLRLMREDPANVDPGTRILFASHYLERIGDRVTNIAEDIVFLASGEVEDLNP